MDIVWTLALEFWNVLGQMAPYLLFGFLFAGVLSVLISPSAVERHLGGSGVWPVAKAAIFGIPLPLCSCGVIPVAASLRRHGANRAATTSFLISTPQTGVDSILVTYSLLGPVFAVFRPLAALVSGLIGGTAVSLAGDDEKGDDPGAEACEAPCCADQGGNVVSRILRYGLITLPGDISKSLLVGLVVAGAISAAVPDDYFAGLLGSGIGTMFVMLALGIPVYVCATASVPVAAALVAKGISPGAVLVFLMTGPATNAAAVTTIWKVMGRRTALIYLGTVALTALSSGVVLDAVFTFSGSSADMRSHEMLPGWVNIVSALALLVVMGVGIFGPAKSAARAESSRPAGRRTATLAITGMTCNHCVQSVQRALQECSGVASADVALKPGKAFVTGERFDVGALRRAIEGLGYGVTVTAGPVEGGSA